MNSGWVTKRLGEVCETVTPPLKLKACAYLPSGKYPVVSQDDGLVCGYTNQDRGLIKLKRPVVIFGDHTKAVKYVDFDFVQGADGVKILEANASCDPRYLYYVVLNAPLRSSGYARHFKLLKQADLNFPESLPEQRRIVAKIDVAFAKIDRLKANAEKNLSNAKELFQSALNEALRPKPGWVEKRLNEVFDVIDYRGKTPTKITSGVPLITAKNIRMGYLDYSCKDCISEEELETRKSRGMARKGDLLFTTEAPLGFVAMADKEVFSTGQRVITFQQHSNSTFAVLNRFSFYYLQSAGFQDEVKRLATGATAQGIKASRLKDINVVLPPIDDQAKIAQGLDVLSKSRAALQANYTRLIADCAEMRQAVLKEAFEGRL